MGIHLFLVTKRCNKGENVVRLLDTLRTYLRFAPTRHQRLLQSYRERTGCHQHLGRSLAGLPSALRKPLLRWLPGEQVLRDVGLPLSNSGVTVVAGTTDYRYPKVSVKGTFMCHPSYSTRSNDYDYALVSLTTGINEDSDISYIAVASKEYAAGTSAQITGW